MLEAITQLPLPALVAVFLASAVVVWIAGTRLTHLVDVLAQRHDLGQAFAGMLLLGGITSLPEVASVTSASLTGSAEIGVNNLLGSASINVLLLVLADVVSGRGALTGVVARPATLMQGTLGMMLLALTAIVIAVGDYPVGGMGAGTIAIALGCLMAVRISAGFEGRDSWVAVDADQDEEPEENEPHSTAQLWWLTVAMGAAILVGGALLSLSGDGIAQATGVSSGLVGFVLVGFATSLPEVSAMVAAARARRFELAVGDIFGTNILNLTLLALADATAPGEPVLAAAGTFELLGALLGLLMTGAFVIGLLERRDRTILRMGYDAFAALLLFVVGLGVMARFA